jgi:septum formation protein
MIVLASQSPRRRELLERAGISFTVRIAEIDESVQAREAPQQYVRRLAVRKAMEVHRDEGECVLAADTTVVLRSEIIGKPADAQDAARILAALAGQSHEVITGICLRYRQELFIDAAVTTVHFGPMTPAEIDAYVDSGEPMDKAGAYGIQGLASRYITGIEGCYNNVVGLPVSLVWRYLGKLGLTGC